MSVRKSLFFSFLDRYSGLFLGIVSSMIIARLLTPAQIGVFSIAMSMTFFVSAIRDGGSGTYLIQEADLNLDRIRAVWTVQLGMGVLLSVVVALLAKPVTQFYEEPQIFNIMLVLAINFAISPFGSLTYALLMRESEFGKLAIMRFTSRLVGALVSIYLAYAGHGPISLAYGSLVATIVNAIVALFFRPQHVPIIPGGFSELRRVFSVGSKVSGTTLFNSLVENSAELLLGKFQNMVAVGLFSRANGLVSMFNRLILDAVGSVALSNFVKDRREGRDISEKFVTATSYIALFGWMLMGVIAIFPELVLLVLYGDQWGGAAELLRLMVIGQILAIPVGLFSSFLTSIGHVGRVLKTSLLIGSGYIILMLLGAIEGLPSIGYYFIVASLLSLLIKATVLMRTLDIRWGRLGAALWLSAKVVTLSLAPCYLLVFWQGEVSFVEWKVVASGVLSCCLFVLACYLFKHPVLEEFQRLIK